MFNVNTGIVTQSTDLCSDSTNSNANRSVKPSQFHEQKLIESYCQESELLKVIKDAVATFTQNYNLTRKPEEALAPILIRLDFVYTQLIKHGQQLLYFALQEPLQFEEAVKYSVYGQVRDLLKTNDNGPKVIDITQLHTQWRILDLPLQEDLLFNPAKYRCRLGLALVHGILSAYTPPEILVLQSIWYCGGGCMRNAIQTSSTEAPLCPNCSRSMSEYPKLRTTENYRLIAILPNSSLGTPRTVNRINRPIIVRLRAHTYDCELKLGGIYLNPKNMKNEREDSPLKAENANGFRSWRSRRVPVQLGDFLVSDMEKAAQSSGASAVSNVSPVVSASSSRNAPKRVASEPKAVCFEPNDDEFPTVGTIRKKAKTAPSSTVVEPPIAPVVPMVIAEEEEEVSPPKRSPLPEKYSHNKKRVNKWLESVQQPEMQSQQLPVAPPQLATQQAPSSAPAIVKAVPQVSQASHVPSVTVKPTPCVPTQRTKTASAGAGSAPRSATYIPTNRPPPVLPRTSENVHSAPLYTVVPQSGRPNMRTLSTSIAHAPSIGAPSDSAVSLITGPNKRLQERRQRREQYSLDTSGSTAESRADLPPQLSDELMLQQDHVPSSSGSENASFVRELQQAVASNNPAMDIVSQSTLNWNAVEFQPRSLLPPPSDEPLMSQVAARYADTRSSVTERRRRQRFNRTLKPDTMFELLEMPGDSQEAPAAISPRGRSNQFAAPSYNNDVNQSVFRLTSLPLTGIGTDMGQEGETGLDMSHNQTMPIIYGPDDLLPCETSQVLDMLKFMGRELGISRGLGLDQDLEDHREEDEDNSSCLTFDIIEGEEEEPSECLSARTFDIPVEEEEEEEAAARELNNHICQLEEEGNSLPESMRTRRYSLEYSNPICPTEQAFAPFEAGDSPPLLDMDPSIHQVNASPFLTPECKSNAMHPEPGLIGAATVADANSSSSTTNSSHNKSSQPRYMLFLKGNAARHNVEPDLNFMPLGIKKLYNVICSKYSDYAFVYTLSAQLGQGVMPMECYVYLKMALLVSLASIEPDEQRTPISVCVICTDSCATSRLMKSVGLLAPRYLGPHEGGQLPSFSGLPPRNNWIQASPLMLVQQGVYFVGDWNCLSRDVAEELEKSMENNSLIVPQQQTEQPLQTAIWTYWQPENASNQTEALAKLCPIFGMPVYMDGVENDAMWDFVLREHRREGHNLVKDAMHVPIDNLTSLLELVQQRKVVFTKPAEHLLKKYYIVSRVLHPTAFSSKTYVVLKQFAESITKLAMRLDVLESDVIVAIFHCENFVRNIFGAGEFPPPSISNFRIISRIDPYMNIFTRWLFQYLERFEDKAV